MAPPLPSSGIPAQDPVAYFQQMQQQALAANPNPTPKELLDAYRTFNNGQLPPGMTPEQANLIDSGMGTQLLAANPALATLFQQISQNRVLQQQEFAAAREQVGQNYQNLTGDVENQGNQWMADIAGAMGLTPEQMAMDPNVNQYGQTIQNMGETADQNQATDQAWFDKMAQVYDQSSAALLQSIAMGQLTPVDGSGGGGGGGGRGGGRGGGGYSRRGYGGRGYGGGSGGDGWSDPKTTDSMTEAAASDALRNYPGFSEDVLAMFEGDPEAQEVAARYMDAYGGFPHNVAKGMATNDVPAIEALLESMGAQRTQYQTYQGTVPALAEGAVSRVRGPDYVNQARANALQNGITVPTRDAIYRQEGIDPDSEEARDPNSDVYQRVRDQVKTRQYLTPEQNQNFNEDFGITLMNMLADMKDKDVPNDPRRPVHNRGYEILNERNQSEADKLRLAAQISQAKKDKRTYEAASVDPNFSFEGWEGYTPPVDREKEDEQKWLYDIAASVLGMAREYSPNYGWQDTKLTMKDSSSTKTTQSTKDPDFQLYDNNVSMDMPAEDSTMALPTSPIDMTGVGGFGQGIRLSDAANRLVKNRMDKVKQAGEANQRGPVGNTDRQSDWDRATNPFASKRTAKAPAKTLADKKIKPPAPPRPIAGESATARFLREAAQKRIAAKKSSAAKGGVASKKKTPKKKTPTVKRPRGAGRGF